MEGGGQVEVWSSKTRTSKEDFITLHGSFFSVPSIDLVQPFAGLLTYAVRL